MKITVNYLLIFIVFSLFSQESWAFQRDNVTCGIIPGQPLTNAYGPWDYTNPEHKARLPIVINAHFNSNVERLIKGQTGPLQHDLDYTLRAIPNFHRALNALSKYHRRMDIKYGLRDQYWTAECYFKRAIHHQPADSTARILFAIHLHLTDKHREAEKQYIRALNIQPNNPEAHYNLGLLYIDMNELEKADVHASKAYQLGYPLNGLKNKLAKANSK